ncbi:hypothetical protein DWY95_00995 [Faecalibacterium sp. AF28-13AC]|nr:hypothetical protein DWY95_00995 [Faecalibacterium sp. AF28-13AC]
MLALLAAWVNAMGNLRALQQRQAAAGKENRARQQESRKATMHGLSRSAKGSHTGGAVTAGD